MKKHILWTFLVVGIWPSVMAQGPNPSANPQLVVVKAFNKTLILDSDKLSSQETDMNSSSLVYINPNWIDSMAVIKGKDVTDKYGIRAQNGVVVVTLNGNGFSKMRLTDRAKFKED